MGTIRYVKGFLLEPFLGIFAVPVIIILFFPPPQYAWMLQLPLSVVIGSAGILLISIGLVLITATTFLFAQIGEGSAAPWDPPKNLVVHGIYRYTRNPMVLGVLFTVLGECILTLSIPLFLLFLFLFIGNHILFVKGEEPELIERFGEEYKLYMENVPRWIPRSTPWTAEL
ncbi:MAG: methyltransferase family protein [Candidatus Thorarchaeota archaeon]